MSISHDDSRIARPMQLPFVNRRQELKELDAAAAAGGLPAVTAGGAMAPAPSFSRKRPTSYHLHRGILPSLAGAVHMTRRALVLGAGGIAAYAWQIGLVYGMAEAGLDVRKADLFVGTSAGSRVAAQLAGGAPLEQLFQSQLAPPNPAAAPASRVDFARVRADVIRAKQAGGSPAEVLKRIGAIALATQPSPSAARRDFVASQLPSSSWPARTLIATVNAETGERAAFDSATGISLLDAVLASGAVAGIYPPVEFRGQHFMDGGFYAIANADLAAGCDRVLVSTLRAGNPPLALVSLESTVERLQAAGACVEVILPDDATEAAFGSTGGMFDPAVAAPAASAAREQGHGAAKRIAGFWR